MTALWALAFLAGLDNLQAASALGLLPLATRSKWTLAVAFGLFESLMPLLGLTLGRGWAAAWGPWSEGFEWVALMFCGTLMIGLSLRESDAGARISQRRWLLCGVPLFLSLDNALAGLALGAIGYPLWLSAAVVGGVSTGLCLLGLYGGSRLARILPADGGLCAGVFLVALAQARWLAATV